MIRFYTDIDYVLHYYTTPFFKTASSLYEIKIDENSLLEEEIRSISHMDDGLSYHSSISGMSSSQIDLCVSYTDRDDEWYPTSFGEVLGSFLGQKKNEGHEVIAVTARKYNRPIAQEIVRKALGISVPVFCCDTEEKHLIINDQGCDRAFYFEDHAIAAKNVAEKFKKENKVFVPDWPWNRKVIKETYKDISNLKLLEPQELINVLETEIINW